MYSFDSLYLPDLGLRQRAGFHVRVQTPTRGSYLTKEVKICYSAHTGQGWFYIL
uniref:Uncharacterized protein n=1 Tax=Arundo donax TaxID=35708 RepID=A0A0A9DEB4_ARUDO